MRHPIVKVLTALTIFSIGAMAAGCIQPYEPSESEADPQDNNDPIDDPNPDTDAGVQLVDGSLFIQVDFDSEHESWFYTDCVGSYRLKTTSMAPENCSVCETAAEFEFVFLSQTCDTYDMDLSIYDGMVVQVGVDTNAEEMYLWLWDEEVWAHFDFPEFSASTATGSYSIPSDWGTETHTWTVMW